MAGEGYVEKNHVAHVARAFDLDILRTTSKTRSTAISF
jgi:hypothetical protein